MDFILSKALWTLATPSNALTLGLLAGTVLLFARGARWRRAGRPVVAIAAAALLACAVLPLGRWVAGPLEDRFPAPALPAHVDGVVMLGGAAEPELAAARGVPAVNGAAERLLALADLGRRYPDARLVASGGSAALWGSPHREAAVARAVLEQAGLPPRRVLFEDASRNTWENALFSRDLVRPGAGEVWLLVTSAAHMPRAVGVFRRLGWPVVAHPVDYRTPPGPELELGFAAADGLDALDSAVREWIGLVGYRALGRTEDLFPAP